MNLLARILLVVDAVVGVLAVLAIVWALVPEHVVDRYLRRRRDRRLSRKKRRP